MKEDEFEKLVREALAEMPEAIRKKMDNVAVIIEDRPSEDDLRKTGIKQGNFLLGLYQGTPKTAWGRGFGMRLPDKITIFQESIENLARTEEEAMKTSFSSSPSSRKRGSALKEIVKNTVWHEIAHHFGFDEKAIRTLEQKRKKE